MKFFSRAAKLFRKNGWRKYRRRVEGDRRRARETENFQRWIQANRLTGERREAMRREIENFDENPLISILLPVYNVEEKWLRLCIESVKNQIYENWELCIADDCSPSTHVRRILEEYAAENEKIKVVFREKNGHISAASNSALELATGEFVGLLDHDDELGEDALFEVVKEINQFPETDFIYSDEDMIDESGARYSPKFKSDFSLDYLRSVNYVTHFAVYRTEILREIGGFNVGLEGSQDYDLALRVVEKVPEKNIRHIPKIIYHWRAIQGSVALSGDEKPYAHQRARQAIHEHLRRTGKQATIEAAINNLHRVRYELPDELPKVNLILAVGDDLKLARKAIENYIGQTDYANLEITVISKSAEEKSAFPPNVKFIAGESASEAENFNLAVARTTGDVLCFADTNLKPLAKDWLKELVGFVLQTEIGAVGAKILDTDESVLHGGLIFGDADALVSLAHRGHTRNSGDNIGRLQLINNFSAVSVSCLAVRREAFESVGGFDAESFPNRFFDADFCLRLREENLRIVYTPYAELIKINRKRRLNFEKNPISEEKKVFIEKWKTVVERDPFYNQNLSKRNADFSIKT